MKEQAVKLKADKPSKWDGAYKFLMSFFEMTHIHGFFYFALPFLRIIEKYDDAF